MNRADIDTERVYRCTTSFRPEGSSYRGGNVIGLCKVVEIPPSGSEVLVRQVNGRLEPQGKTIAARLSDIKVAGEHDIERAIRETQFEEADAAWRKLAKAIKADYSRVLQTLKIEGKVELNDGLPYEYRYSKPIPDPEKITREMVEASVTISIKGPSFAKALGRLKPAAVSPARRSRRSGARQADAG